MDPIERRRRWLRAAFGAAMASAGAPAVLVACSSSSSGAVDAGRPDDGAPSRDAGVDRFEASSLSADACVGRPQPDAAYYDEDEVEICPVTLPCGLPPDQGLEGCAVVSLSAHGVKDGCFLLPATGCADAAIPTDASLTLECYCDIFSGGGRRPAGWRVGARGRRGRAIGRVLARMAEEEAASIEAFRRLGSALSRLGAPARLVAAAARAGRDEVRHARSVARQAARFGASPGLSACPRPARSTLDPGLEALALENAREGCVRETFAALLACWQGERAGDAALRAMFARIAEDETRHAALAWAIADWAGRRLGGPARRRVARARHDAARALGRELEGRVALSLVREAGMPESDRARALHASLRESWSGG